MVSNTTRLSALLLAHVFEKYVDSVEDGNLLDHVLPRYFPTFEIDVFFEHVCKMQVMWLVNGHTCSRNTTNVLPRCPYFALAFEKGAKSAAGRKLPGWLAGWLALLAGWLALLAGWLAGWRAGWLSWLAGWAPKWTGSSLGQMWSKSNTLSITAMY